MGLEDVYKNMPRKSVNNTGFTGSSFVTRERDPKSIQLENDVFGKMNSISNELIQKTERPPEPTVNFVSVEDAIRELSDISKSGNDIS